MGGFQGVVKLRLLSVQRMDEENLEAVPEAEHGRAVEGENGDQGLVKWAVLMRHNSLPRRSKLSGAAGSESVRDIRRITCPRVYSFSRTWFGGRSSVKILDSTSADRTSRRKRGILSGTIPSGCGVPP